MASKLHTTINQIEKTSEKRKNLRKRVTREREDLNLRSLKRVDDLLEISFTGWTDEDKTDLIERVIQEFK